MRSQANCEIRHVLLSPSSGCSVHCLCESLAGHIICLPQHPSCKIRAMRPSLHALFLEFTLYMERHTYTYAKCIDVVEMILVGIHFDWGCYHQVSNKEFIFLGVYGCMCI